MAAGGERLHFKVADGQVGCPGEKQHQVEEMHATGRQAPARAGDADFQWVTDGQRGPQVPIDRLQAARKVHPSLKAAFREVAPRPETIRDRLKKDFLKHEMADATALQQLRDDLAPHRRIGGDHHHIKGGGQCIKRGVEPDPIGGGPQPLTGDILRCGGRLDGMQGVPRIKGGQ